MITKLNLLPISFRKRLLIWARVRQWIVCLCLLLILMSYWGINEYFRMASQRNRVTQLNAKAHSIQKVNQANQILTKRSQELSKKEAAVINTQNSDLHLQVLGMISQCTHPLNNTVQVLNYKLEQMQQQNNSPQKRSRAKRRTPVQNKATQNKIMKLDLKGLAENDASIASFIQALQKYEFFDTVKLKVVNRIELSSQVVRSYQIECTF